MQGKPYIGSFFFTEDITVVVAANGHDCSKRNEFLTPACFPTGDASLCTGARNSSLGDNF